MTLFKYLLREILPQFFTSLCIISAVIVISQLIQLSEVLVAFGLSLENVMLPFLFILVPFLAITIPISYMFAVLLSFSRLSADGEFTAMLASGYSLKRAAKAVLSLGLVLYVVGAICAMNFEAWGRRETLQFRHRKTQTQLDNIIKVKLKSGVFLDDFLGYVLYAEQISPDRTRFENVMLAPGADKVDQNFTLLAPSANLSGSVEGGDLKMTFDYGVIYASESKKNETSVMKFKKMELDLLHIFQDQIFGPDSTTDDFRSYTPTELWKYLDEAKSSENPKIRETYPRARFLFHQRLSMPFAAITFSLFAMVLGIQDERRGKGFGYIGAILTIIGGYILMMSFKWLSERGQLAAPLGAWIPNVLLLLFGGFLVYQKNRLPPSESTMDPHFIPGLRRWIAKR